ncbi:hypothetical protein AJ88_09050 [Mesorhizobium amorphae CCBAU 01583]|nr:hypothetical protein AJ88_09050 [Mesorhizobium amorphae CCBAU 01583]
MLDSVADQSFGIWEHILVDDGSTDSNVVRTLKEYAAADPRFAVVECDRNHGISEATNEALRRARGKYVVLLDHDDALHPDALLENARVIGAYPEVDLIYSDEDKTNSDGEFYAPYFKPDWSPVHLLTRMCTGHLSVYRRDLVNTVGGFRPEFDGTQDYDLALRVAEKTQESSIYQRYCIIGALEPPALPVISMPRQEYWKDKGRRLKIALSVGVLKEAFTPPTTQAIGGLFPTYPTLLLWSPL